MPTTTWFKCSWHKTEFWFTHDGQTRTIKPTTIVESTITHGCCKTCRIEFLNPGPIKLTKPVRRETSKIIGKCPVLITIAPAGSQSEALIGLRLKGRRTEYVVALSDLYRLAALWHGQKEASARRTARKNGTPWRVAKKAFYESNRIPKIKVYKEDGTGQS